MKIQTLLALVFLSVSITGNAQTDAKQAKLNELVKVMNMDSMVETMYVQMEAMMRNMSTQLGVQPSEQAMFDKYYKRMSEVMKEDMSWEKMKPGIVDIYTRNFSEEEIDDMLTFYKSETGKSLLQKMPSVMQESMQMSQSLMQTTVPKMQQIAQELRKELEESRKAQ